MLKREHRKQVFNTEAHNNLHILLRVAEPTQSNTLKSHTTSLYCFYWCFNFNITVSRVFLLMSKLFCSEKCVAIVTQPRALIFWSYLHLNKFLLIAYFHFDLFLSHLLHCKQPLTLPIPNFFPLPLQHKSYSCKAVLFQNSILSALQSSGAELPAFLETSLFCNAHNLIAFLQQILLLHTHVNNYIMP